VGVLTQSQLVSQMLAYRCYKHLDTHSVVARGLWSRVFKSEKRTNEAGPSVSSFVPSVNSPQGVTAQMMDPVAVPTCDINGLAEDWDVGLFPGSFPSDETLQGLVVSSSDQASADDAAMVPLPLQFSARKEVISSHRYRFQPLPRVRPFLRNRLSSR
jgi:hypothetical protein